MIELKEEHVRQAFKEAKSDEVKETLTALFPDIAKELTKKKPTLDDYTTITSYEDACEALGLTPIYSDENVDRAVCEHINNHWDYRQDLPKHIKALLKLETIAKALWGRNWEPVPDAEGKNRFWYPWFALWNKKEMEDLTPDQRGALLSAGANFGAHAGFGCLHTYYRTSFANAHIGFRLCQETEEKAKYFGGRNFIKLWAEYLQFNFVTGDFLIPEQS